MTRTIDAGTGGGLEAEFYQQIYEPLSAFFVHANAWSLSRHVDGRRRRGEAVELFARYVVAHGRRSGRAGRRRRPAVDHFVKVILEQ